MVITYMDIRQQSPELFLSVIYINLLIYYAKEKYNIYDKERPENLEGVLPMYF